MTGHPRIALLASALVVACGARTGLDSASDASDAEVGGGPADTVVVDSAPACRWARSGPANRVSGDPEVPGDVALQDAVATTGGALVAWRTAGDLSKPQTVLTRLVAFDFASSGFEHMILRAPGVASTLEDVSVASGHGHVGIVGSNGAGCTFHPLTVDGASNGSTVVADPRRCGGLVDVATGFDLLAFRLEGLRAAELVRSPLDEQGRSTGSSASLFTASVGESLGPAARATLDDGSFLVLLARDRGRLVARHFDALGAPTAGEMEVTSRPDLVSSVLAKTTGGALAVFLTFSGAGPSQLWDVPLDRDGRPLGEPSLVATGLASVTSITLVSDPGGGALLAWTEYDTPTFSSARVLSLSSAGEARGGPFGLDASLPSAAFAPAIRLVVTGTQALVLLEASTETTPHRVYAVSLACSP